MSRETFRPENPLDSEEQARRIRRFEAVLAEINPRTCATIRYLAHRLAQKFVLEMRVKDYDIAFERALGVLGAIFAKELFEYAVPGGAAYGGRG
jgi:hypothetical protein